MCYLALLQQKSLLYKLDYTNPELTDFIMAERDPKSIKGDFKFAYKNTLIVEEEPRLNVPMLYTMKPGSHAFAVAISSFGPAHCVSLN